MAPRRRMPALYKAFGEAILPYGTTTVIADPHEVVNVAGGEGLKMFLDETDQVPISIFTVVPSCVPYGRIASPKALGNTIDDSICTWASMKPATIT